MADQWVLRIVGSPVELWFNPEDTTDGLWIIDYDPDGYEGCGDWTHTKDRRRARRFPSAAAVLDYYRQQSTVLPLRPDGKPNRPLTMFTNSADRVPS
jgi:hypothetical protein